MPRPLDRGQSTVEFALVLPLILLLLLGLLQAGLMLRDQLVVAGAAREGAREAAVSADPERIEDAAHRAAPGFDMTVRITRGAKRGDLATVKVSAVPKKVPLVGGMLGGKKLEATAVMRVERAA